MIDPQVCKRYAKAVYDLSLKQGEVDAVLDEVESFSSIIENNPEIKNFIKSPITKKSDIYKLIESFKEQANISEIGSNFIRLLAENNRLKNISEISNQLAKIVKSKNDILDVEVTSTVELSDSHTESIKDSLEKIIGSKVLINNVKDKSILGGLVIKIGSKMIDASLLGSVKRLSSNMKESLKVN